MSKGRAWAVTTIIVVALVVALGVGLGLGLYKSDSSGSSGAKCTCAEQTTSLPTTESPLYVKPSVSIEGHFRFAAVAPDAADCAAIGTRIMAVDGGTAIDAAIATILCVGVYNAVSCGIGGGHFMTYYNRSSGEAMSIIAREQAPSGATQDMYTVDKNVSSTAGGMAIGIPGEVRGLHEAHKLGGRLPWATLFEPAIKICRDGFPVGPALQRAMVSSQRFHDDFPNLRELSINPETGNIYAVGEIMRRPKLANTLAVIAAEGPDAFYNGSLSKNISADIAEADKTPIQSLLDTENSITELKTIRTRPDPCFAIQHLVTDLTLDIGGIITEDDLANYSALVEPSLKIQMQPNYTAFSPPPPSSGVVYLSILNILNGFNMSADSVSTVDKTILTFHRIAEAFKHTYSLRTQLGDYNIGSDNFKQYIRQLVTNMTSADFGENVRRKINDSRTYDWEYYEPKFNNVWDKGTSHLSVLGPNGDAVAITSTVNLFFGSKVVGSRTGIIFNNEMDDFSTPNTTNYFGVPASEANFIEPWKRPVSSMCPSVVVGPNGDVAAVIGASGGTRITTSTALVTMETLWFNWGVKKAIDYPRIHHQLFPHNLFVEPNTPQVLLDGLRQKGHNISTQQSFECVVQGITQKDGLVLANSDYRKDGIPDGY